MYDLMEVQSAIKEWFNQNYSSDWSLYFDAENNANIIFAKDENPRVIPYKDLESVYTSFYEDDSTIRGIPVWIFELEQIIEGG